MITPNSQAGRLLLHLQKGWPITRISAAYVYGIFDLHKQIAKIEKSNFIIQRKWIENPLKNPSNAQILEYSLAAKHLKNKEQAHEAVA